MSTDGQTLQQVACLLHVHAYANKSANPAFTMWNLETKAWKVKQGNPGLRSTGAKGLTITKLNCLCDLYCDLSVRGQSTWIQGKKYSPLLKLASLCSCPPLYSNWCTSLSEIWCNQMNFPINPSPDGRKSSYSPLSEGCVFFVLFFFYTVQKLLLHGKRTESRAAHTNQKIPWGEWNFVELKDRHFPTKQSQ